MVFQQMNLNSDLQIWETSDEFERRSYEVRLKKEFRSTAAVTAKNPCSHEAKSMSKLNRKVAFSGAAMLILLTASAISPAHFYPALAAKAAAAQSTKPADKAKPSARATKSSSTAANLTPDEKVNISVYDKCHKAVVNIAPLTTAEEMAVFGREREGVGSGVCISPAGHIVTNNHVTGGAEAVKVTFFDNTSLPARVIGTDPSNDLAVIKIASDSDRKFDYVEWGDSSNLQVGRRVFAIGNPFGLDHTMTSGIVSSLNRSFTTPNNRVIKGIIQTDAAINPGNSGGPLLDTSGRLVGITTAILSRSGQSAGIGLAIPANITKTIVPELIAHGFVKRPDLGILYMNPQIIRTKNGFLSGLRVIKIDPKGPAAEAGIRGPKIVSYNLGNMIARQLDQSLADIITHVDNISIRQLDDLLSYIEKKEPGQVVNLTVIRNDGDKGPRIIKIPVKLAVTRTD